MTPTSQTAAGTAAAAARDGSAAELDERLTLELLASQQLRAAILAAVFGVLGVLLAAVYLYEVFVIGRNFVPGAVPAVILCTAAYELAMRGYIGRYRRARRAVPGVVWYVNAFLETSMPTVSMMLAQSHFEHPLYVFLAPAVFAYYLFIMLSALNLDFRVSLFAGAVAAAEYLGFALHTLQQVGADPLLPALLREPVVFVFKAGLLLAAGAGAAFVSAQFRARVSHAVSAARERNRAQEADRLKSRFLANMSHEIRTPLNAILGYAQLLQADRGLPEPYRERVRAIANSGNHLLALINDVLDLSKIEAGREEAETAGFDLRALTQDLATMFQMRCEDKRIGWRMAIDPLPQRVHGDERKLRQILTNLLANAVKLTESGHVALNVLARADERYFFEVVDTGPGLPAGRQARMFAPFEQEQSGRDKGGTGLGLAIASRYALLLGGRLEVESKPGSETRFFLTLRLPQSEERASAAQADPWSRVRRLDPATPVQALVVDDVVENREVLAGMLERIGARVASASTGEEALECAGLAPPDIVFMDMRLPGLSGIEVRARMEAVHGRAAAKFVAVSASVLPHERQSCMENGFDAFIGKPVRMESVYGSLARLLGAQFLFEPQGESGSEELSAADLHDLGLPEPLFKSLTEALQAHDMSQTRRLLEQMEAAGGSERRLARHLRVLDRRYDVGAMLDVLKEGRHG